eukprot:NODE_4869_length_621_cov_54.823427_g4192_i0.p1 GENE.NODE_4869_length_621_cov_54.823427_g4192_i0~~NODE_4869_length_621_cov_54.823427_g4192_i0.p1  ORF type:complete len:98 (+),score=12.00 NODE_4869_length_621_cov_54.823427_g4192_i0:168-461(+)
MLMGARPPHPLPKIYNNSHFRIALWAGVLWTRPFGVGEGAEVRGRGFAVGVLHIIGGVLERCVVLGVVGVDGEDEERRVGADLGSLGVAWSAQVVDA